MPFSYAVIQFSWEFLYACSSPIIPFRILLFTFLILLCHYAFFYSVSNSVIRFRIMLCSCPILWFDRTVLSCSFESYYFLSNSVIHFSNSISVFQFPILLFAFELCSSKAGTCIVYLAYGALGTSKEFSRDIANHSGLGRGSFTESITSMHKCNSTAT